MMKREVLAFLCFFMGLGLIYGEDKKFEKGDVLLRDSKNFYLYTREGELKTQFPDSAPMVWLKGKSLLTGILRDGKVVLRNYAGPGVSKEFSYDIKAESIKKILCSKNKIMLLYTAAKDGNKSTIKLAVFSSEDYSFLYDICLKDPDGNPEILNANKAGIHDALIFKDEQLWISGYPSASGDISCFSIAEARQQVPKELKGLFTEEEFAAESKKNTGKRTKTLVGIAGNSRGLGIYDKDKLIAVCINPPGKLTVFSTETGENSILTQSIECSGEGGWVTGVLVLDNEIFVSNVHSDVKKVYRIDKKSGAIKGIFANGVAASEMLEIQ
jgi:hypothetical protein